LSEQREARGTPAFCDYEGSAYRTDFWEGRGREYEDAAERIALRRLLPPAGERILDVGAGFGRLADLYAGYRQVILLDPSRSLLEEAREHLGGDSRFIFVVGNVYDLPFADAAFDVAVMVRVIHHLREPAVGLREIRRALTGRGDFVLEYANKRNLKAILRYLAGRQDHSPFSLEPWEFVTLNYDFHPRYIETLLRDTGFIVRGQRSVSAFRIPALKRIVPPRVLAALDGLLQVPTAPLKLAPSVFLRAEAEGEPGPLAAELFRCPACQAADLREAGDVLICEGCGRHWSRRGGIHDFRAAVTVE